MLAVVASWATPTTLFILLNLVIGVIAVTSAFASPKKNQNQNQNQQQHQQQQQPQPPSHPGYDSPNRLARSPSLFTRVTSFNFSSSPLNFSSSAPSTPTAYDYSSAYHHLRSDSYDTEPPIAASSYTVDGSESPYTPPRRESKSSSAAAVAPYTPSPPQTKPALQSSSPSPFSRSPSFLSRVTSFNFSFQRSELPAAETVVVHQQEEEEEEKSSFEVAEHHFERTESEPIRNKWKKEVNAEEMLRKTASDMAEATEEEKTPTPVNKNLQKKKKAAAVVSNKETIRFRGGKEKEEVEVDAKADDFINKFKQQLRMQKLDSILRRSETT